MKMILLVCRYCQKAEKLWLEDEETILPDRGSVTGMCELCLDRYAAEGLSGLERFKAQLNPSQ